MGETDGMAQPLVLLSAEGHLGSAIAETLTRDGVHVQTITTEGGQAPEPTLLETASVLVLAADDDGGNVDTALTVRRLRPDLPLVVRLFNGALATYLEKTLQNISILSISAIAAPAFIEATMRAMDRTHERPRSTAPKVRRTPSHRAPPDRVLVGAMLGFVVLVTLATFFFAAALDLPTMDALYFVWTTITTVGYGDIALKDASSGTKIAGMVLMFAGAAFMAVLFALFTGWVVTRRFAVLRGRVQVRGRGHIVIAGGGDIGFRVAAHLADEGHRVVVVERNAESRHIEGLRGAGHHLIIADATSEEILDLAAVEDAGAVLALTDSEATNLHIALLVRARTSEAHVIMRVESPELSAHVSENREAVAISPVAVAAEQFSRSTLQACGGASRQAP
jgi:voltage-gated potassium channel Kch